MKTTPLTPPSLSFIDTAPLAARYSALISLVMAFIAAGRSLEVLRLSCKVACVVKIFIKLDTHNRLLERKLSMLSNTGWRERVLRELGGIRKLKLWEVAQDRAQYRAKQRAIARPKHPDPYERAWLTAPDRIAESERLKTYARMCAKACAPANIVRDRYKMDFDGMFRLAPLARGSHGNARKIKIYTQDSISDYSYNAIPFAEVKGLGPATVWPVEFYAAMTLEVEDPKPVLNTSLITTEVGIQNPDSGYEFPNQVWDERNEKKNPELIPLHVVIDRKIYRSLFENPV